MPVTIADLLARYVEVSDRELDARDEVVRLLDDDHDTHEQVRAVLANLGYALQGSRLADGGRERREEAWATADGTRAVHCCDHPAMCCRYLSIRGAGKSRALELLHMELALVDVEDLVEAVMSADDHDGYVRGLRRLAVACPELDPPAREIFEQMATQAPDPALRAAAIDAIAFRRWPAMIPLLEQVAAQDADAGVRERAQRLLAAGPGPADA